MDVHYSLPRLLLALPHSSYYLPPVQSHRNSQSILCPFVIISQPFLSLSINLLLCCPLFILLSLWNLRIYPPLSELWHQLFHQILETTGVVTYPMLKPSTSASLTQRSSSSATVAGDPTATGPRPPIEAFSAITQGVHSGTPGNVTVN
jgi:hypothetical protein